MRRKTFLITRKEVQLPFFAQLLSSKILQFFLFYSTNKQRACLSKIFIQNKFSEQKQNTCFDFLFYFLFKIVKMIKFRTAA